MERKNIPNFKSWKEGELWLAEIIQQERERRARWRVAWVVTFAILIITNGAWLFSVFIK